jgi:hypothetical protein
VRTAHQFQGRLYVSPGFSLLRLTLFFAIASLPSGLNDRHLAMGFKQLSRIILDFDFPHPHDAVLLSFETTRRTLVSMRTAGLDGDEFIILRG